MLRFIWNNVGPHQSKLKLKIAKRQNEREKSVQFAKKKSKLTDESTREKIAAWDFQKLRAELQKGSVSCVDVVRTYYAKGVKAHEKTNCATLFVKEAEDWAATLDKKAKHPKFVKPPFFGIPISMKECVSLKGYDQTRGFAQDLFKPAKKDSILIENIKRLGMIPFVQTNVPQSLIHYNTVNSVYGITTHSMDAARTPGGSSGGEAAMLAADGTLIGIGSDVGGSLRIPAHYTGVSGFRPSRSRLSHLGEYSIIPGKPYMTSNEGPIAKTVATNADFLKELWNDRFQSERDPYVPPVTFRDDLYKEGKKYRIGYYLEDGWFKPVPACQRAVVEAKNILEKSGHTLVPFKPPRIHDVVRYYIQALSLDGGAFLSNKMINDIVHPMLFPPLVFNFLPRWFIRFLSFPTKKSFPRLSNVLKATLRNGTELREAYANIDTYRNEFLSSMREKKVDALLCPANVMTAPPHDIPPQLLMATSHTAIFNMLDYGAGVVNVSKVSSKDEEDLKSYPETDPWAKLVKSACKDSVGFPVNVQIAAPPFREEIALRILRDIEISVTGK